MDPSFWHERWNAGEIGFHRTDPHPALVAYGPTMGWPDQGRILVPLCGATPDLGWLVDAGLRPVGVELSPIACARFFDERGVTPKRRRDGPFNRWEADGVVILEGDVFDLDDPEGFDGLYDRAATVALPSDLRARYATAIARTLRPGSVGLLVTMADPSRGHAGPWFSVDADAVHAAWGPHAALAPLAAVDGMIPIETAWRLVREPSAMR